MEGLCSLCPPRVAAVCVCNEITLPLPALVSQVIPVCRHETLDLRSETRVPSRHSRSLAAQLSNINWQQHCIGNLVKLQMPKLCLPHQTDSWSSRESRNGNLNRASPLREWYCKPEGSLVPASTSVR